MWTAQPLWYNPWLSLLHSPTDILYFIAIIVWVMSLTPVAIISFPFYILAVIVKHFLPNYGKFIGYFDAWMEEDFLTSIPRNSIVTTLTINGNISLDELRAIFERNVLEAPSTVNPTGVRYPELKQYLITFMGFRVWKNDDQFRVENHIVERSVDHWSDNNNDFSDNYDELLRTIHQDLLNVPYKGKRSPWEIILIRNVTENSSLLACRTHHVLADAKSLLKLFVVCLGGKELKTANPQNIHETWKDKLVFYPLLVINYLRVFGHLTYILLKSHFHPWKVPFYWRDFEVKTVVGFSPKLMLADVKKIAKKNGVTSSAVVMSIVAGSIRKCGDILGRGEVSIGYTLPKPDHPEMLTNHVYMGFLALPTDKADALKRLKQCNSNFLAVKANQQGIYANFVTYMGGKQLFPFTRLAVNQFAPTGITNIAGEEEGFSVGNREVTDFRMSVGTLGGVAGVVFCVFSYRNGIRIAVIAKGNLLGVDEVNRMAFDIGQELEILRCV